MPENWFFRCTSSKNVQIPSIPKKGADDSENEKKSNFSAEKSKFLVSVLSFLIEIKFLALELSFWAEIYSKIQFQSGKFDFSG